VSGEGPRAPARERLAALLEGLGLEPSAPAPCPYLPGREARMIAVRPERLTAPLYQSFLELNFRRLGDVVYRPTCDGCRECRQLRVDVAGFRPSRSQRRCLRRNADVAILVRRPQATAEGYEVYRRYLRARHDGQMSGSRAEFAELLGNVTPFTEEVVFRWAGRLLGAGVFDATPRALSAVYFYFDPLFARRAPGILHVLWLVEECRRRRRPWLYLGYHVAGCAAMAYKAGFRPHQRLGADGAWG
jgi:arginyl-tRNA--protein-N-Asp/Glu arginylyltransferase